MEYGESVYAKAFKRWFRSEPQRGWGDRFASWALSKSVAPYNSFGNGSAMRVSPVAWYADNIKDVLALASDVAKVTHDHPDGIKGARAVALAIYLARIGWLKNDIVAGVEDATGYDLKRGTKKRDLCTASTRRAWVRFPRRSLLSGRPSRTRAP